jgi:hypothetical protein
MKAAACPDPLRKPRTNRGTWQRTPQSLAWTTSVTAQASATGEYSAISLAPAVVHFPEAATKTNQAAAEGASIRYSKKLRGSTGPRDLHSAAAIRQLVCRALLEFLLQSLDF